MSSSRAIIKSYYSVGIITGPIAQRAAVSGTMAADIAGPVMTLDKVDQVAFQVKWTSSNAVGVISIQASNDPLAVTDPANAQWDDLTFTPALAQPNSNNGQYVINLALIPFTYVRFYYDRTSGTGNMTVRTSAKGV